MDDVTLQLIRGERIPDAEEQWTLANSMRRTQLNDYNKVRKWNWEYESDDDFGEDLGQLGDDEDLDQEAAGELEEDD